MWERLQEALDWNPSPAEVSLGLRTPLQASNTSNRGRTVLYVTHSYQVSGVPCGTRACLLSTE